jgi:hypothetical protein
MSSHAFIDESIRRGTYFISVATAASSDLARSRRTLRGLLLPGQRRLHFATESDRQRRAILTSLAGLATTSVVYLAEHPDQRAARAAILERAAADLPGRGVTGLTIEGRSGQDHRDRAVLYRLLGPEPPMTYRHLSAAEEPMLWIPDAVAWAFGRGGVWKRQLDRLGLVDAIERVTVP